MAQLVAAALSGIRRQDGQGMVEYALILALIGLVVVAAVGALGSQVSTLFCPAVTILGATCPT